MKGANQDTWTHPEDQREIRELKAAIENYRDFIGFIHEKHIDYQTESETWREFDEWQEKQFPNPPKQ